MSEQYSLQPKRADELIAEEISLLEVAITLAKHKKTIFIAPLVTGVITLIGSFFIPDVYTANTSILPPQQQSGAAAMLASQIGSLSGMSSGSLGIKNPNDIYVAMLRSRTVSDNLIRRFHLQQIYEIKTRTETGKALAAATKIESGKNGLITVSVDDHDPKRAAALANAYIEELQNLTQVLAVTEASRRRIFYERQLTQTRQQLADSELSLKQIQERTGLIQPDAQAVGLVQATANLRAQIAMKEVQLGAMQTFATGSNPDYMRTQRELAGLHGQLAKVETGSVTTGKAPEAGLEYIRRIRDVKYYETISELLSKQFEMARLDEAKESSLIQVLDKAVPPEQRSKPKRTLMMLVAALAAGFLTVLWAFITEALQNAKADAENGERLKHLQQLLCWK